MSFINTFVLKLWKWYKGHEGVADAHHTKYTDADVIAAIKSSGGVTVEGSPPDVIIKSILAGTHSKMLSLVGANRPCFHFNKANTGQDWCMVMGSNDKWFIKPAEPHTVLTDTDGIVCFATNGNTGFGDFSGMTPSRRIDINDNRFRLRTPRTPAHAGGSGYQGDICWDTNYVYVCVATNTWKRSAITTW